MHEPEQCGHIRSFVRRERRLTTGQQRAIAKLWHRFGIDHTPGLIDLDAIFGRHAPRVLEIGFGDGESLAATAQGNPEQNFLGIEVHRPGVGHLLLRAEEMGLTNLRVIQADAVPVLTHQLPDGCLDRIQIFFPDPWPKKRHHKRRLIQPAFVALLARKLKSGAYLQMATDWENYALHMRAVLENAQEFINIAGPGCFATDPGHRPSTKFERRGHQLGHRVWDLVFRRL